jgi:hypothetical protein
MGDIGNAISGAINTVENLGSAVGDLASGNVSGALGDVGKAATSGIGAAVNGFMAANPEMGAVGKLGQGLSGLLGQAGGAGGLGQAGGSPSPFGLGNLLPGILQNPLGSLFGGGGSGGGGGLGGLLGGGGASGGGPDFGGIGQGISQGGATGGAGGVSGGGGNDPNGELGQLKNIDAGAEAFQLALSMEQVRHQESMAALKAMGSAFQ